jgi:hypothetical protein
MANVLLPIAPKLAKLLPRLATSHDGEVVATVRAIERTLKSAGASFHEPAVALTEPVKEIVYLQSAPQGLSSWRELAIWCCDNDRGRLGSKERQFILDMAHRLVLGGQPTEKQGKWLRSIYASLRVRSEP